MAYEEVIKQWIKSNKEGGLILPDGWFGRPHDNQHKITYYIQRPHKLIIELDNQLMLIFTDAKTVRIEEKNLIISSFMQMIFDYQLFGDKKPGVKVYNEGEVKFVG